MAARRAYADPPSRPDSGAFAQPTSDAHVAIGARGRLRELLGRVANHESIDRMLRGREIPNSAHGVLRFVREDLLESLTRELGAERSAKWFSVVERELAAAAMVHVVDADPVGRAALSRALLREKLTLGDGMFAMRVVRTVEGWTVEGSSEPPTRSIGTIVRQVLEQAGAPTRARIDAR